MENQLNTRTKMVLDEIILKQYGGINSNSLDNIPRDIDADLDLNLIKTSHYFDDQSLAD